MLVFVDLSPFNLQVFMAARDRNVLTREQLERSRGGA